jgi:tetratricopeptide (TPR) repeat protein
MMRFGGQFVLSDKRNWQIVNRISCLVFLVTLLFFFRGEPAQSAELSDALKRYEQLKDQGRYAEAESVTQLILELAIKKYGSDHQYIAKLNDIFAAHYIQQGMNENAEQFLKRSLAIKEKTLGLDHPNVAKSLDILSNYYHSRGRYSEAEPLLKRSMAIKEKTLGPAHPEVASTLNNLASNYDKQGRHNEAELLHKRSLAIKEKVLGADHHSVALSLSNLASNYDKQGRYKEAEPLIRRSLKIREKVHGMQHPDVATSLNNLAGNYYAQGRYKEAEPLFKRSLKIYEMTLAQDHPDIASSLNNLASNYDKQGRYEEAEPLIRRSLKIREKVLGPDHPDVGLSLTNLANNFQYQGRYTEAEPLYERSLTISENTLGPNHPDVAISLNNLAINYSQQGKYGEAEPLVKRSLAINEKILGSKHPEVATVLNNLASIYGGQGRYAEVTPLLKRSLKIKEKALGSFHPDVAVILNNLASNYHSRGRYDEAGPLYKRSLEIYEKAFGSNHPDVASSLNNLASNYTDRGRFVEAEPLLKRSLEIRERTLGLNHPDVAGGYNSLADNYLSQGRFSEAEPIYKHALDIYEKTLGVNHPKVAETINMIAKIISFFDGYGEAEPLLKRSLSISEKAFGPNHSKVASTLGLLALNYFKQSKYISSLAHIRRSTEILTKWHADNLGYKASGGLQEKLKERGYHLLHLQAISKKIEMTKDPTEGLISEAFTAGQKANESDAGNALSRMAARFAPGDDELAKLVRKRQDAVNRWRVLDRKFIELFSTPLGHSKEALKKALSGQLKDLEHWLEKTDKKLSKHFPEYAALTTTDPLALSDAQSLLKDDEALLSYLIGDEESYLWVLRPDRAGFHKIKLRSVELEAAIKVLRGDLEPKNIEFLSQVPAFDTTKAYELYMKLLTPAEPLLDGVRHVMVVPDGALQSLPLGVLVTEKPTATEIEKLRNKRRDFSGYRQVPWLAKKYAFSTLPSVSSLKAIRVFAKKKYSTEPFVGFGDPVLDGDEGNQRGVELASLFSRGTVVDVAQLKSMIRLPDTADELKAMAASLNADKGSIYLGLQATETRVKELDLSNVQVLAFATHGLITGQRGVSEPGLVLTPPETQQLSNKYDDGFLTASEVAQLKLNADWVILSACNTASPDGTPGAEALSGLAKAFFYAGSRALLVSHWKVDSDASVKLTTRMLYEAANDNKIGRAEALKRSMLSLMQDNDKSYYAHPMFWAPFTVVGEGG